MNLFQENQWHCNDCDLDFYGYGPQYTCPDCGSDAIDMDDEDEEEG